MSVFRPEHKPLDQIFAAGSNYRIPAYQRPYSWEARGRSDRDNQVNRMWEDLLDFFSENRDSSKEYFLGSMVIIEDLDRTRTFDVIDGQQRLTTLLLMFGAMRCVLREVQAKASSDLGGWCDEAVRTLDTLVFNKGFGLTPTLKLKIERKMSPDYNEILAHAINCKASDVVSTLPEKFRIVAERYFNNRDYLMTEIKKRFVTDDGLMDVDRQREFDQFFRFLAQRVAIVLITTSDFSTAFRVFEILNNRGLPLSNLDLLRSFVLEQFQSAQFSDGEQRWERLESEYSLPEEFLGRFAESKVVANLHGSAFNGIRDLFEKPDGEYKDTAKCRRIELFVADLECNIRYFNRWLHEDEIDQVSDRRIRHALSFIKLLGNERYSANLILALFRATDFNGSENPMVLQFLRIYRSYALNIYLRGRYSAASIYKAIGDLNCHNIDSARARLTLADVDREALVERLKGVFSNDEAKRLLAACVWEESERISDVASLNLDFSKTTLEHIIPQKPANGTNWMTDFDESFRRDFTNRLGNMTLLTQSTNSTIKNYEFQRKRAAYQRTFLPMTKDVAAQVSITKEYLMQRHQKLVEILKQYLLDC